MTIARTFENYSAEWYTPPEWWDWIKEVLGPHVFDPCPPRRTQDDQWDGLSKDWNTAHPAYINHPGGRGQAKAWWQRTIQQLQIPNPHRTWWKKDWIWCAFSVEQFRHLYPHPREFQGFIVEPRERVAFIWGGPNLYKVPGEPKLVPWHGKGDPIGWQLVREHGKPCKSPATQTVFFSTSSNIVKPPVDSIITRCNGEIISGISR